MLQLLGNHVRTSYSVERLSAFGLDIWTDEGTVSANHEETGLGEGMYANLSFQSAGWAPKLEDDGNGVAVMLFVGDGQLHSAT